MNHPDILVTICARGGSKGVKNKNILPLLGKPLIYYTIEQALEWGKAEHVVVSTDSEVIAKEAKQAGAEVPFIRPDFLALDDTPKLPVLKHAVNYYMKNLHFSPDFVVDLDPTSPLRMIEDIDKCFYLLLNEPETDAVITGYLAKKNPYYNMVERDSNGFAHLSKSLSYQTPSRQEAPQVYSMNASIYVWRTHALLKQEGLISEKAKIIEMPEERSVDIDSEVDLKLVELLMNDKGEDDLS